MVDLYYSQALYQYGFAVGAALAGSGGPARTRFADPDGSLVRYNFVYFSILVQFRARTVPKITQIISCVEAVSVCEHDYFYAVSMYENGSSEYTQDACLPCYRISAQKSDG